VIVDVVLEGRVVATYPFDNGMVSERTPLDFIAREAKQCAIEDGYLTPEKAGMASIAVRQQSQ
jgi:hypothetical protein